MVEFRLHHLPLIQTESILRAAKLFVFRADLCLGVTESNNTRPVKCLAVRRWLRLPLETCGPVLRSGVHEQYESNPKHFKDLSDSCVITLLMNIDSIAFSAYCDSH